jgi:hypothetical protein
MVTTTIRCNVAFGTFQMDTWTTTHIKRILMLKAKATLSGCEKKEVSDTKEKNKDHVSISRQLRDNDIRSESTWLTRHDEICLKYSAAIYQHSYRNKADHRTNNRWFVSVHLPTSTPKEKQKSRSMTCPRGGRDKYPELYKTLSIAFSTTLGFTHDGLITAHRASVIVLDSACYRLIFSFT